MNATHRRVLEEIRKWEEESMTGEHPMVFISYSYDNEDHCLWVGALRDKLRADGVNAIIDQSLPSGYPLNLFMEQILKSPQLKFVVCVCSKSYAEKADSGTGGVGYEQAIMTRELTSSYGSNKIIPVLRNNPDGYVPTFLGTKKYLDFRNDQNFKDAYFELTGDIFGIPRMPSLGKVPDWIRKKLASRPRAEEETLFETFQALDLHVQTLILDAVDLKQRVVTCGSTVLINGVKSAAKPVDVREAAAQGFLVKFDEETQLIGEGVNSSLVRFEFYTTTEKARDAVKIAKRIGQG